MAKAVIPRRRPIEQILGSFNSRIRRLEVNRTNAPPTGTAIYVASFTGGTAAGSWSPDFSSATATIADQIGCTPASAGLIIPDGWVASTVVQFGVNLAEAAVANDMLQFGAGSGEDVSVSGLVSINGLGEGTEPGGGVAIPAAVSQTSGTYYVGLQEVESVLGTTFTPNYIQIAVWAIELVQGGWPVGGGMS